MAGIKVIRPYEKGVVVRLGRYHGTSNPGLALIVPFIDSLIRVDVREQVMNVMPQEVITKDNVVVTVDAVIYYKVIDPVKAEFEIENFSIAATTLAQTTLRNLIGDKQLDEILTARDHINANLRDVLDEATDNWGVKITKVELQKIDPPKDITDAMSKQMKAEREKRARILEAQGIKEANILTAEGKAQAVKLKAEAEAEAIRRVGQSAEQNFTERAQVMKRLEVAREVLGTNNTKWILPTTGELVNVLNLEGKEKIVPVKKRA